MKFRSKTRRATFEELEPRQLLSLPPVVANPIGDVFALEDASSTPINLAAVFSDPDPGDTLSYLVTTPTTVANVVDQVSETDYTYVHQDLLYTHEGDDRGYGADHDLARNNIEAYFVGLGLTTALEPFTYSSATYYNVVGTKLGATRPNDVYIVGAHYDSVNNPGADDNASGTAAVMEAARVLSNYQFDATLRFIAFDREEQGLKGSYAYVAAHDHDNILGMVNLDMIAYNPAGANYNKVSLYDYVVGGSMKSNLATTIATYAPDITSVDSGQIWGSDHSPFEENPTNTANRFDAALIIEYNHGTNPYYHQATDAVETPGNIDYAFATKITRAATGYLAGAAGLRSTSLDADGNGTADALSDGILTLRYLFDSGGAWNVADAVGSGATRTTREEIKTYLDATRTIVLDVDDNGAADALTDGILILRYLFDPTGQWNVADALGAGAMRTTREEIRGFLNQYAPAPAPGASPQTSVAVSTTNTVLMTYNLGPEGQWKVAGALVPGATRTSLAEIEELPDRYQPPSAPGAGGAAPELRAVDSVLGQWPGGVSDSGTPGDDAEAEEKPFGEGPQDWLLAQSAASMENNVPDEYQPA